MCTSPRLSRSARRLPTLCAVLAATLTAGAAHAVPIVDPRDDLLPSYVGPRNAELDVLRADVTYNGVSFEFSSVEAGPISGTSGALFVWGIDRGAGTRGFPEIAPGVLFDSVVVINPTAGTTTVRDLVSSAVTILPAGSIRVSGDSVAADVPAALLPSLGFLATAYTANLWPRSGAGGDPVISDFAPDNSNFAVTVLPQPVPEPVSAALLVSGLAGLAAARRRRATSSAT